MPAVALDTVIQGGGKIKQQKLQDYLDKLQKKKQMMSKTNEKIIEIKKPIKNFTRPNTKHVMLKPLEDKSKFEPLDLEYNSLHNTPRK